MQSRGNTLSLASHDFVLDDLLQALAFSDQRKRSIGFQQYLRAFREGIIVFRGHGGAVGACAFDNHNIADPCFCEQAWQKTLWIAGFRGENVAALAAMAYNKVLPFTMPFRMLGNNDDGMLRAVHAGPRNLCHAGIHFDECVAVFARIHDINDRTHQGAGVCGQVGSRFDFKMQCTSRFPRKRFEFREDASPDFLQIRAVFRSHPRPD